MNKKVTVQESRAIVKRVLSQLKAKGLLKESPEGESNKMTTDLQNCVSQLTAMKDQIGQILITNMDSEETTILSLIDNQIDFISTTINNLITTSTAGLTEMDNPAVNMSVDKVIEKPDVLKKLEDKKIDVNVVDDDGKSLVENSWSVNPSHEWERIRGWQHEILALKSEMDKLKSDSVGFIDEKGYKEQIADLYAKIKEIKENLLDPLAMKHNRIPVMAENKKLSSNRSRRGSVVLFCC